MYHRPLGRTTGPCLRAPGGFIHRPHEVSQPAPRRPNEHLGRLLDHFERHHPKVRVCLVLQDRGETVQCFGGVEELVKNVRPSHLCPDHRNSAPRETPSDAQRLLRGAEIIGDYAKDLGQGWGEPGQFECIHCLVVVFVQNLGKAEGEALASWFPGHERRSHDAREHFRLQVHGQGCHGLCALLPDQFLPAQERAQHGVGEAVQVSRAHFVAGHSKDPPDGLQRGRPDGRQRLRVAGCRA
mmetsp:Transcript_13405/g.49786  ORF Transcript_13405/g.49786 Transcript_13405/m.49786 type:complete len:240 (+) Transcript_13405:632-1351(+)